MNTASDISQRGGGGCYGEQAGIRIKENAKPTKTSSQPFGFVFMYAQTMYSNVEVDPDYSCRLYELKLEMSW